MRVPPEASVAALERALGTAREIVGDLEGGNDARAARSAFAGAVHRVGELLWIRRAGVSALLAEEIEHLARAPVPAGDAPRHALRRRLALGVARLAGGALPGAPERANLLLLNEWRARRGARLVSEAALFTADLPRTGTPVGGTERGAPGVPHTPRSPAAPSAPGTPGAIGAFARELRPRFQEGLAAWLRERAGYDEPGLETLAAPSGAGSGLARMVSVFERVADACAGWPGGALWRLAHAWGRGMEGGTIPAGAAGLRLLGRADRELRRLGEDPRRCLGAVPSAGLLANLLFYLGPGSPGDAASAALGARFGVRHRFRVADLPDSRKTAFLEHLGAGLAEHAARLRSAPGEAAGRASLADALDAAADSLGLLGHAGARRRLLALAALLVGEAGDPAAVTETGEGLHDLALALSGTLASGDAIAPDDAPGAASRQPTPPRRVAPEEAPVLPEPDDAPRATSRPPPPSFRAAPGEAPVLPDPEAYPPDGPPEDEESLPPRLREELARSRAALARLESARRSGSTDAPSTPGPAMDEGPARDAAPATEASFVAEFDSAAGGEAAAGDPGRDDPASAIAASIGRSHEQAEQECGELSEEIEDLGELVVDLRSQVRRLELALGASTGDAASGPGPGTAGSAAAGSAAGASLLPRLSTGVENLARMQGRLSDRADRIGSLLSRQGRRQRDLDETFAGARPRAAAAPREVLVVEAGGERVGFLLSGIEGVARLTASQRRTLDDGEPSIEHARRRYRVRHLGALLGLASETRWPDAPELVLVAAGQRRLALVVDTIVGRRRYVLDPPGRRAAGLPRSRDDPPGDDRTPLQIIAPEELPERRGR